MGIIIFIMILAVLLIVIFETGKRFTKKRKLEQKENELKHKEQIIELEKKKMEMHKEQTRTDLQKRTEDF